MVWQQELKIFDENFECLMQKQPVRSTKVWEHNPQKIYGKLLLSAIKIKTGANIRIKKGANIKARTVKANKTVRSNPANALINS